MQYYAGVAVTNTSYTSQTISFTLPPRTPGPVAAVSVTSATSSGALGGLQCPTSNAQLLVLLNLSSLEQVGSNSQAESCASLLML